MARGIIARADKPNTVRAFNSACSAQIETGTKIRRPNETKFFTDMESNLNRMKEKRRALERCPVQTEIGSFL
jgi:hypothetical protein